MSKTGKFSLLLQNLWEEDQYEFESLDAYCLSDTGKYYYNAKYSAYIELEEAWSSIDEVRYGKSCTKQKTFFSANLLLINPIPYG